MPSFIVKVVLVTGVFAGHRISVINQYPNRRPRNPLAEFAKAAEFIMTTYMNFPLRNSYKIF